MGYIHIFQWKFGNIKYPSSSNPNATVATSGCGPCAALMILENMTDQRYGMPGMDQLGDQYGSKSQRRY